MPNYFDSITGKPINLWGTTHTEIAISNEKKKTDFLRALKESPYFEITDADFNSKHALTFDFQVNGKKYRAFSVSSPEFRDQERLFRKVELKDFSKVQISSTNFPTTNYKLNPPEEKAINSLFEQALKIALDQDGEVTDPSRLPQRPKSPQNGPRRKQLEKLHSFDLVTVA